MTWQSSDAHRVHAEFTNSPHTMKAELAFNDEHELVDLVTDDRSRASADGHHFTQQRWTTPLSAYRGHRSEARRDLRRRSLARPRPRGRVQLPRIQRRRTHLQHCTRKHIDKQKYPKITPARPVADAQTGLARLRATLGRMIGAVPQWQDNRGAPGSACSDALARAIVVATGEGNQPAREDTAPCVGGGDNSESHAVVDGHFPWFCANSLGLSPLAPLQSVRKADGMTRRPAVRSPDLVKTYGTGDTLAHAQAGVTVSAGRRRRAGRGNSQCRSRAVGVSRGQTCRMITADAVIVAVFAALLGIALGVGFDIALQRGLHDQGITVLAMPSGWLSVFVLAAGFTGVLAAVLPARRAARVNVRTGVVST